MAESMPIDDDVTIYCKNCKRDIPQHNFQIHDIHCYRNVRLCPKCEEPIPISEMDEHIDEYHAIVECVCKVEIEKAKLEEHQKRYCSHRTVHCQFCEMDMKHAEIEEHEHACGSRTEKCQDCGEFVMLKNALLHVCDVMPCKNSNKVKGRRNYRDTSSTASTVSNNGSSCGGYDMFGGIYTAQREEHIPDEVSRYLGDTSSRQIKKIENQAPHKDHSTINVDHDECFANNFQDLGINDKLRAKGALNPKVKKQLAIKTRKPQVIVSDGENYRDDRHKTSRKNAAAGRRSRYEAKHPRVIKSDSKQTASSIIEPSCTAIPSYSSWDEKYHDNIEKAKIEKQAATHVTLVDKPSTQSPTSSQNFELPCEICERLFPLDQLEAHQESCLDAQRDAFRQFDVEPSKPEEVIVVDDDQGDDITFIPCEFCGEKFPADNVILHQPYCDTNQQKYWQPPPDQREESSHQRLDEFSTEYQAMQRDFFNPDNLFNTPVNEMLRNQFGNGIVGNRSTNSNRQRPLDNPSWDIISDDEDDVQPSRSSHYKDK